MFTLKKINRKRADENIKLIDLTLFLFAIYLKSSQHIHQPKDLKYLTNKHLELALKVRFGDFDLARLWQLLITPLRSNLGFGRNKHL
jgi:hypothetical protein